MPIRLRRQLIQGLTVDWLTVDWLTIGWLTIGCSWLGLGLGGQVLSQETSPELAMAEGSGSSEKKLLAATEVALAHKRAPAEELAPVLGVLGPPVLGPPLSGRSPRPVGTREKRPTPRTRNRPWVHVRRLEPPYSEERTPTLRGQPEPTLPPWSLFDVHSRFEPPEESSLLDSVCHFPIASPRESDFSRAMKRIGTRKIGSEVRRRMKRNLRRHFESTPTMGYSAYLSRLTEINRLGRHPQDYDDSASDQLSNELRQDVFQRSEREGERDFEIFDLGPLVVMDSGSVRLDLARFLSFGAEDEPPAEEAERAPGAGVRPLLAGEDYRVRTSVKLGFDPLEALDDPTWLIDRYGVAVEVTWLSDVLGREVLTTECEVQVERNGDFAAFINLVFRSRN